MVVENTPQWRQISLLGTLLPLDRLSPDFKFIRESKMSITYPQAPSSPTAKRAGAASVMNSGSALFPTGSTSVYERAAKARNGKSMPLAWIAAPVAVVLIGGAVYLSAAHQKATPPAHAASTAVTTTITAPATSLNVKPVAPSAVQTTRETHIQTSVTTTAPAPRVNPAPRVTRTATVSRSVSTPPAASTAPVTPAPTAITPAPAPAAATPGTFAFTPAAPAASTVNTTPETVTPPAAVSAPAAAPSPDAQPAPQA